MALMLPDWVVLHRFDHSYQFGNIGHARYVFFLLPRGEKKLINVVKTDKTYLVSDICDL